MGALLSLIVGGRGFSLANFDFTVGSFALANCVRGHDSSPVNLNFIARSFTLVNYFSDRGSLPANLDFTALLQTLIGRLTVEQAVLSHLGTDSPSKPRTCQSQAEVLFTDMAHGLDPTRLTRGP
ncbi:hypothetical protein PVK06_019882 [Gossypium arboreum]|uniref:Uncharacterized protein n=1 Tax=Gossypium arboreum TaxID=29729 RepID=A0ABR0PKZ3_GOSAR|nr:hypothetical protein PVK06_019882 [Gossypium arboreum]